MKKYAGFILVFVGCLLMAIASMLNIENVVVPYEAESQMMINYMDALNSESEYSLVYVSTTTCTYCIQQKPIVEELLEEYPDQIIEMTLDEVGEESIDDYYYFFSSTSFLRDNQIGTPMFMVVKDGETVDVKEGLSTKEDILKLANEYGIMVD